MWWLEINQQQLVQIIEYTSSIMTHIEKKIDQQSSSDS